jgi:RNA polymerase subunit RPABC4/transcription elongation factor Spt4
VKDEGLLESIIDTVKRMFGIPESNATIQPNRGEEEAQQYDQCSHCGGDVTGDSDFCPHCGVLFAESKEVFCDTDTGERAVGICIMCRKLVCGKCSKVVHGRRFCSDHKKIEVQQDWAKVYQSTEINDAELMKSVLEDAKFRVLVQNFNSIGYSWDGGGDSPQSRSNLSKPAKVFVPIPEYFEALKSIQEWESSPTNTEQ